MTNTTQAIKLLSDNNLVWSSDFETIRPDLVAVLEAYLRGDKRQVFFELRELTERLTDGVV
jgi:hypothetical protein